LCRRLNLSAALTRITMPRPNTRLFPFRRYRSNWVFVLHPSTLVLHSTRQNYGRETTKQSRAGALIVNGGSLEAIDIQSMMSKQTPDQGQHSSRRKIPSPIKHRLFNIFVLPTRDGLLSLSISLSSIARTNTCAGTCSRTSWSFTGAAEQCQYAAQTRR